MRFCTISVTVSITVTVHVTLVVTRHDETKSTEDVSSENPGERLQRNKKLSNVIVNEERRIERHAQKGIERPRRRGTASVA